jgi:hypothetical protein
MYFVSHAHTASSTQVVLLLVCQGAVAKMWGLGRLTTTMSRFRASGNMAIDLTQHDSWCGKS